MKHLEQCYRKSIGKIWFTDQEGTEGQMIMFPVQAGMFWARLLLSPCLAAAGSKQAVLQSARALRSAWPPDWKPGGLCGAAEAASAVPAQQACLHFMTHEKWWYVHFTTQ
jgi:hypothetical protein